MPAQWQIRFDNGHQQRYLPDRQAVLRYVLAVGLKAASPRFEVFRESDPTAEAATRPRKRPRNRPRKRPRKRPMAEAALPREAATRVGRPLPRGLRAELSAASAQPPGGRP